MAERLKHNTKKRGREVTRREFLGLSMRTTLAVGIVVTGGPAAVYYLFDRYKQGIEVDKTIREYGGKEGVLEPTILGFEKEFEDFESLVFKKFESSDLSKKEKESLSTPFEIARINRQNPNRNFYLWLRKDLETRRSLSEGAAQLQNPNYFFFDLLVKNGNVAASFAPMTRALNINSEHDPKNLLDNLIAFHELVHVAQDNQDRQEIPYRIYEEFFRDAQRRKKVKVIGLYEASAYIAQIYLLNLLTDGQFRQDALAGRIDPLKYRGLLNSRPEQDKSIVMLGQMANQIYRGKSTLEGINGQFLNYINNFYRQQGMEVYERLPNGYALSKL